MGQYNFGGNGNSLVVRHYVTMCAALCCSPPYSARSWQANPRPLPPSQESGLACSSSTSQQQHAAATTQHPACSSLQPHPQTLLSFKIQFEHCWQPPPLSTFQLNETKKRSWSGSHAAAATTQLPAALCSHTLKPCSAGGG